MIKRQHRLSPVSLILSVIGGLVSGLVGTGIANINLDNNTEANLFCLTQVLVAMMIWLFHVSLQQFKKAYLNTLVFSAVFIFLSIPLQLQEFTSRLFLLQFVFLSFVVISFFLLIFSLSFINILFREKPVKGFFLLICVGCFITASALLSSASLAEIYQKKSLAFSSSFLLDTILSWFPPLAIVISGLFSLKFSKRKTIRSFYQKWAIALSTFGNTSFYNQDLSHVDFTNTDLANIDLRARSFYRTCFRSATGLDRAWVDNRYIDLDNPKVQQLLTQGTTSNSDLRGLNLQGAYLKAVDMTNFILIETNFTLADLSRGNLFNTNLTRANLSGADLQEANLQNSILIQTDLTGANLAGANITGACIENWNINGRTNFTNVQCDYIYRQLNNTGIPTDRFPTDRDFEPGEFESLYQEVENVVELIFKEGVNWRAVAFTLQKLELEDEGLGLELRGIEKRGDLWVVKVAHNKSVSGAEVERRLYPQIEEMKQILAAKEHQINQLLGIASDQAEALKELSRKPFGNSFFITGSTITNLTGEGQIKYEEAANQVRRIIASSTDPSHMTTTAETLISQLQSQRLAVTLNTQAELIQQVLLAEAQKDAVFQQFLLHQGQQIASVMPESAIASAIQGAIFQLNAH